MILLVDKPTGITSFDCIRRLRKKLGIRKMGHSGTLDPAASGLMIIATESDTKKLTALIGLPKRYEVEIQLGIKTDSADLDGRVVEEQDVLHIKENDVERVVREFKGAHTLFVPVYSAIKQNGVRLYEKARKGKKIDPPRKVMEVISISLVGIDLPRVRLVFDVTSGTYIRSLAEEFGRRLGVPAVVSELRRTRIGDFDIKDAEVL